MSGRLHIIGGGLAGSAIATVMAEDGVDVTLYDAETPFESRWTRGLKNGPSPVSMAEPEVFYDPEGLVAGFFARCPEIPENLIRPVHSVLALKRDGREPAVLSLNHGIAHALSARRPGLLARLHTGFSMWQQRFASDESRVERPWSPGFPDDKQPDHPSGTYHNDSLGVLAEALFSTPAHRCSRAQLSRVLAPRLRTAFSKTSKPVFGAIDPVILNDIALPALREHFIRAGGTIMANSKLDDIDSTPEYATDLFFTGDRQVTLTPDDAVVLALHPRPLCDAVPDIGIPPAPARRQAIIFEMDQPFAEPLCLFTGDDIVRAVYCNLGTVQVILSPSLRLPASEMTDRLAARVWRRCVWQCDHYLNVDLKQKSRTAENLDCPDFGFIDAEAPFPELTPGLAAFRHRLVPPWNNLFLCGDSFPADYAPGPAALFASVRDVQKQLQVFLSS